MDAETAASARTIRDQVSDDDAVVRSLRAAELDKAKRLAAVQTQATPIVEPSSLALVEVSDVATMLGVSRQRAHAIVATQGFPRPIATPATGPVFLKDAVQAFANDWRRVG